MRSHKVEVLSSRVLELLPIASLHSAAAAALRDRIGFRAANQLRQKDEEGEASVRKRTIPGWGKLDG
jgi:hypothetical protein